MRPKFILLSIIILIYSKLLRYNETNWKNEEGFELCKYGLTFNTVHPSKTRKEQQAKIEKISLVGFLNKDQRKIFVNICRRLKRNDKDFYQNKNLHATLFGFGPLEKKDYERIRKKIQQFCGKQRVKMLNINFDAVRPGTMYCANKTLSPVGGVSNGTVVAVGDVTQNESFCNYANRMTSFLLKDKRVKSILGDNFRSKFPTVWCTLGYYNKMNNFRIASELENIFNQYNNLNGNNFEIPISEIALVKSKYKNLRYPKLIQKFKL
ncbi:MAG: hypothetical protein E6K94_00100 [Thaumarchaeota archaeon]|nr:MAG: hypothetical protein E6K94_00100 [Nitrososphaerota archaeon]